MFSGFNASVNVADKALPMGTLAAPLEGAVKLTVGGVPAATVKPAVAVVPEPPSMEETAEVMFVLTPAAVPFTVTLNVQEAFAASAALERLTAPDPAAAVMAPAPQEPLSPLGVETIKPPGSGSLNPTPVKVVA